MNDLYFKIYSLTLIIFVVLHLIAVAWSDQQLAPMMGLTHLRTTILIESTDRDRKGGFDLDTLPHIRPETSKRRNRTGWLQ